MFSRVVVELFVPGLVGVPSELARLETGRVCLRGAERARSCLLPTHPPWGVVSRGFCLRHPLLGSLGVVGLGSVGVAAESNPPLPYMLLHTECIRMTHDIHGQVGDTTTYNRIPAVLGTTA